MSNVKVRKEDLKTSHRMESEHGDVVTITKWHDGEYSILTKEAGGNEPQVSILTADEFAALIKSVEAK